MEDLGRVNGKRFEDFSEDEVLSLADKYNASYLVFRSDDRLNFTKLYENQRFAVYKLP